MADDIYSRANQVTVESYFDDLEWTALEVLTAPADPSVSTAGKPLNGTSHVIIRSELGTATTYDLVPWFYFEDAGWTPFPNAALVGLTGTTAIVARIGKAFKRVAFTLENEDGTVGVRVGRSIV